MKKINLGSGPVSVKGWTNYDWGLLPFLGKYRISSIFVFLKLLSKEYDWKWPKIEMVDIRNKLPDEDFSVDYIYCSHVLEHFEKFETKEILIECHRVLKRKGVLRIVLPDLKKLIVNYKDADNFSREFFGFDKDLYNGILGRLKRIFIRGHQWMYDTDSIKKLLKECGFKKIKVYSYRRGTIPQLKNLDIAQHEKLSLYLEASDNLDK